MSQKNYNFAIFWRLKLLQKKYYFFLQKFVFVTVYFCGLFNLCQIVFYPSILNKEKCLFVQSSTFIRRSYCQRHRTIYFTIPKTRPSSQDWSKNQKKRLKTQARLIWTVCLRPAFLCYWIFMLFLATNYESPHCCLLINIKGVASLAWKIILSTQTMHEPKLVDPRKCVSFCLLNQIFFLN